MAGPAPSASSPHSLEKRRSTLDEALERRDLHLEDDNHVCWNEDAKSHPRRWGFAAKTYTAFLICWLEMFMTAISSSGTATAEAAMEEYGMSRTLSDFAFVILYLLGQTIGGIFCSPISEVFGRRTIYIIGSFMFCIFSAIVAAIQSPIAVYFGRFFQGIAAAIPATVAFGNFDDLYDAEHRIWVVYIYTLFGMVGLALGPIYSVYVTSALGCAWRWVYYISTMVTGATGAACIFLKESNPKDLLQRHVEQIEKEVGNTELHAGTGEKKKFSVSEFFQDSLFRPLVFIVTEPLVFFCAGLCAIAFGLIYGLTESLSIVYQQPPFNFSQTSSSLAFIPIIIGELLDILPRFYDSRSLRVYRQEKGRITPESKIASFAVAAPSLAIGLWLFAWTIPPRVTNVPWPVSMIGLILIGFALNDFSHVLFGYITDSYGRYAASAVSAVSLARTMTAAVFPLFTYQMYTGLGSNVATTILASVATAFAFTPILFLRYGGSLRSKIKAIAGEEVLPEMNQHMKDEDELGAGLPHDA